MALILVALLAGFAQAEIVRVTNTGIVIWNGIQEPPLSGVGGGENVILTFLVDSNLFDEGAPGDTRGYLITEPTFELAFSGGLTMGLLDPSGETPYFTLVEGLPVSDGFFVSTSPFSPGGVPPASATATRAARFPRARASFQTETV